MNVNDLAKICHETNRAYCQTLGDNSQPAWEQAPENIRKSAIDGVGHIINTPGATPKSSHENWMKFKIADGWRFGFTKDVEKKTHPCLLPYEQLPIEQKMKDRLFMSVIRAFVPAQSAAKQVVQVPEPAPAKEPVASVSTEKLKSAVKQKSKTHEAAV